MSPSTPPAESTTSFEYAMKELEAIVHKLENSNVELEQAIKDYAKGMELKAICEKKLADAKLMVEKVVSAGGQLTTEAFDPKTGEIRE